jgi:hypothetical protein
MNQKISQYLESLIMHCPKSFSAEIGDEIFIKCIKKQFDRFNRKSIVEYEKDLRNLFAYWRMSDTSPLTFKEVFTSDEKDIIYLTFNNNYNQEEVKCLSKPFDFAFSNNAFYIGSRFDTQGGLELFKQTIYVPYLNLK